MSFSFILYLRSSQEEFVSACLVPPVEVVSARNRDFGEAVVLGDGRSALPGVPDRVRRLVDHDLGIEFDISV